ncbi:hypothetical protein PoB_006899800 [Plakobranchus ocellatus]|uniref:Uncharacterized protein n=1 Tax=Plakobranchus ocellatus TaxID=259542 RepID=A0AAV4DE37_9GAST|nr:hypothetical protein PoB_006899800 [Plakobranchus ocellatus]
MIRRFRRLMETVDHSLEEFHLQRILSLDIPLKVFYPIAPTLLFVSQACPVQEDLKLFGPPQAGVLTARLKPVIVHPCKSQGMSVSHCATKAPLSEIRRQPQHPNMHCISATLLL